ncbi:MAG: hypothetical protein DRH56_05175 [Deltaproteobacteria bacterium]|nr:MAG: hypothetical protein DRH56_05175 [Deltaproteobacteria bacterium]
MDGEGLKGPWPRRETKSRRISSENNPLFKTLTKLNRARGIRKYGLALFSRPKQVREIIEDFPECCEAVVYSATHDFPGDVDPERVPGYRLDPGLFRRLDHFNTGRPLLLVRVPRFPLWTEREVASGCTLCIPFQDPANVGAVIRSAAAFGAAGVVLLEEAAHPFLPTSTRSAGSALFRIPLFRGPSIHDLDPEKSVLFPLCREGKDIGSYRFPLSFCLVPGLEGEGLPRRLRMIPGLSIPMAPGVESLNAALATGIALYLWRRQKG